MKGVGRGGSPFQRGKENSGRERTEAPLPITPPIPSWEALTHERGGEEANGGGREAGGGSKMAGGCGKVSIIVTNLTVGLDGCRGWAICFGSGGSSDLLWEAKPPRRNSSRLESKEDQEVLAWHSCSLRDPVVPKEH